MQKTTSSTHTQKKKNLTNKRNFLPSHLLELQDMQAVAEAGHGSQRGGFQQEQVLVQGRGSLGGRQTLNTLDQVSVLALCLAHHLEKEYLLVNEHPTSPQNFRSDACGVSKRLCNWACKSITQSHLSGLQQVIRQQRLSAGVKRWAALQLGQAQQGVWVLVDPVLRSWRAATALRRHGETTGLKWWVCLWDYG